MKAALSDQLAELHQFILQAFTHTGHSPTLVDIQQRFSLNEEAAAEALLAELEETKAIHRALGDSLVTHAYPFSNEPTPHRVTLVSGVRVYSMCAVDALGIPFMLNTDATIESECRECKHPVAVRVQDGKVADHVPDRLMVGYVPMGCCSTPATEQCPLINFFCSPEHFKAWRQNNPGRDLKPLTLDQGLEQGARIFGSMMSGAQGSCC